MSTQKLKNEQAARRISRVRAKIKGTAERPRLCVYRSLRHISAQLVDDVACKTLVSARDTEITAEQKKTKKAEKAALIGKLLAERAKSAGITMVVFDRRDKKYHGRVKAVAEGAREAGLIF